MNQGSAETTGLMESYVSKFEDLAKIVPEEFLRNWKDARHTLEEYEWKISEHNQVTYILAVKFIYIHSHVESSFHYCMDVAFSEDKVA